MSKKLTKTIILIVFVVLLGIKDVEGKKLSCLCELDSEELSVRYSFGIDSNDWQSPSFLVNVDGKTIGDQGGRGCMEFGECGWSYYIENFSAPIEDNGYTYTNDFISNQSCPSKCIYIREDYYGEDDYHFLVSDDDNASSIIELAEKKYKGKKNNKAYIFPCIETVLEEDEVEPEPTPEPEPEEEEDNSEHPGVEEGGRVTGDTGSKGYCGSDDVDTAIMENIPADVPRITKFIYSFLQVLVPLAIIILGSIDLVKAISAQKEDEIKKGQQMLIKRLITAVIVFFVFALVKLLVSVVSENNQGIVDCVNCFLTNDNKYCNFN